MSRLNAVYPKIGANATTPVAVDLGDINAAALTTPTATKAVASAAIAGAGFIAITINGSAFNLITVLD